MHMNKESDWKLYQALREQWTHEDNLVNHRAMWLILSQGLLFTAYGTLSNARLELLVFGFPFFGIVVAALAGVSIFSAIRAAEEVGEIYRKSGLDAWLALVPSPRLSGRGKWSAQSLPFIFCGLWLLAMVEAIVQ
jgi:hypothetical protein